MLNLQIHLLWASSGQHVCGIKQNKLSESILPSVMLGLVATFICTSVCFLSHSLYISYTYMALSIYLFIEIYTLSLSLSLYIYIYTPGYTCMSLWIKSGFPDTFGYMHVQVYEQKVVFRTYHFKMATSWGMHWLGPNGVFTSDSLCAHPQCHLLLGSIFLNTFP